MKIGVVNLDAVGSRTDRALFDIEVIRREGDTQ
jgi:hypothetical protein